MQKRRFASSGSVFVHSKSKICFQRRGGSARGKAQISLGISDGRLTFSSSFSEWGSLCGMAKIYVLKRLTRSISARYIWAVKAFSPLTNLRSDSFRKNIDDGPHGPFLFGGLVGDVDKVREHMARTPGFHSGKRGSIPLWATNLPIWGCGKLLSLATKNSPTEQRSPPREWGRMRKEKKTAQHTLQYLPRGYLKEIRIPLEQHRGIHIPPWSLGCVKIHY